ncbi:hypothetical protein [uncultured Megasphaera sp.]|uniref:hypothetical protein n=1 Tax=uncultured Megasphaera sp. TaxID=165188 RepID=UPI00262CB246|nr:hypothetical protein [uncultured Megasphaera sp.]
MNQINVRLVNQINAKHAKDAKIRVHANHLNVNHANLAKTLAPASLAKVSVVQIATIFHILFLGQDPLRFIGMR